MQSSLGQCGAYVSVLHMLVMVAPFCRRPHTVHAVHPHAGSLRQRVLQRVQKFLLWPLLGSCLTASNPDSVIVAKRQKDAPQNTVAYGAHLHSFCVSASLSSTTSDHGIRSTHFVLDTNIREQQITHRGAVIAGMTQGHGQAFSAQRLASSKGAMTAHPS